MPISFGSVGDIISVCLIVKDLVAALDDSRGSAAEYREVRLELRALERALLEVEVLSRSHNSTVKLNALYATARKAALDCRQPVQSFLDRIKKYDPSLGESASRNIVKNTAMKIRWQVSQKDELIRFRAEINAHSSSISMLLATVNVNLAQTNQKEISDQNGLLEEVRDRLAENNAVVATMTTKVKEALKLNWFAQLGAEIKDFMHRIITVNIATYNIVLSIQGTIYGGLQRSLAHEPFILDDAIGRVTPVHVQFINSWEAFDAVLDLRFRNIQGHMKVKRKEYILQEHSKKREICRSRPWEGAFLPGQRIDMSLIFDSKEQASVGTSCPSCNETSEVSCDSEIQCKNCGICYRRVTEVFEMEPPTLSSTPLPKLHRSTAQFGKPSFNDISYGPKRPSQFQALPSSPKRKLDSTELEQDDLSQFKRIRLVSKEKRIKFTPGPFSQHPPNIWTTMDPSHQQEKDEKMAWDELRALQFSLGDTHPDTLARLNSFARMLRNWGKYGTAEMIIRDALESGESELLAHRPEVLQIMLAELMSVLVEQKKLIEAEELWHTSVETFRLQLGNDSAKVLEQNFNRVHPLRSLSSFALGGAVLLDENIGSYQPVAFNQMMPRQSDKMVPSLPRAGGSGLNELFRGFIAEEEIVEINATPSEPTKDTVESPSRVKDSPTSLSPSKSKRVVKPRKEYAGSTDSEKYDQNPLERRTTGRYGLDGFKVLRTIGTGSFARVRLVQSKSNERFYALKIFSKKNIVKMKEIEHVFNEKNLLHKIQNQFIPPMWGTFQDSANLYMISTYVEGGELFSLLRKSQRFPNSVAKFYAAEVVLAIAYLHSHDIVYRDIKPENILLDRHGHIKLCDFGFAKEIDDVTWTLCGTPDYIAPEVIAYKGYNHSVDWWALGILIFEMLCGYTPFWDEGSPLRIYENILKDKIKYPSFILPDAKDLLQGLITADLSRRLGNLVGGVRDIQEHAWFKEVTWDRLAEKEIDAPYIPPIRVGTGDTSMYDEYQEEEKPYSSTDEYRLLFAGF